MWAREWDEMFGAATAAVFNLRRLVPSIRRCVRQRYILEIIGQLQRQ